MATILFDGRDAYRKGGTGIATYARILGTLARKLGFRTQQVVSSEYPLDKKDAVLNEIRFHELPAERLSISQLLRVGWRCSLGGFADVRPSKVLRTGAVVDPTPESKAAFETTFASFKLFLVGEALYRVHGRRAVMRFERTPEIFHATFPMPLKVRGARQHLHHPRHHPDPAPLHDAGQQEIRLQPDQGAVRQGGPHRDRVGILPAGHHQADRHPENRITNTYQSVSIPADLMREATMRWRPTSDICSGSTWTGISCSWARSSPRRTWPG